MIELYELAAADPEIRFSPYCWRIRMALAHKGLDAQLIPWHFGEKRLPRGCECVPVLVDDGQVIGDSIAIARHLESKYENGPSLFGCGAAEGHARFITAWTDAVLHDSMQPLLVYDVYNLVRPEAQAQYRETREKRLGTTLEQAAAGGSARVQAVRDVIAPLNETLAGADFIGGDEPTFADYAVFGAFMWARCVSKVELLSPQDPTYAWRERLLDLFDGLARDAKTPFDT